ncbi:unnamed protein product, partial [Urochloa humidicola]
FNKHAELPLKLVKWDQLSLGAAMGLPQKGYLLLGWRDMQTMHAGWRSALGRSSHLRMFKLIDCYY